MTIPLFDRKRLKLLPLKQRVHDLSLRDLRPLEAKPAAEAPAGIRSAARAIIKAREKKAPVILMMGAHVLRAGVQRHIIEMMKNGDVSCLALNGAGVIHDFEYALIGATTESVARYIREGQFGLWNETGRINDIVNRAYARDRKAGFGESVGRAILKGAFPHKDISVLAQAYALGVPVTVHIGMGYDIIHEHPNFDAAASGALSYNDFLRFASLVEELEGGVVMNFGSAVMAPEIFLKALSMARNVAKRRGGEIRRFTTLVCDLRELPEDFGLEPDRSSPSYYFRPWKTMLVRTVKDGGRSFYVRGRHGDTVPALWGELSRLRAGVPARSPKVKKVRELAIMLKKLRAEGRVVVHCHGCFDLLHPGHMRYFQSAKLMGDVLVVTCTPDRYIDKGPGRPVFNQDLRAESLAALESVDFVAINEWPTAEETLRLLRPDIYVKGQEFEKLVDKTGKIQKEERVVREIGAELRFTHEIVFSSSKLINENLKKGKPGESHA